MSMTGDLIRIEDTIGALIENAEMSEEERESALSACIGEYLTRADDLAAWFDRADSELGYLNFQAERIDYAIQKWEKKKATVRAILAAHMEQQGGKAIKGHYRTISLRPGAVSVEILDADAVPAEYKTVKQSVSIDKRAIRKAIEDFQDVPGAALVSGAATVTVK